MAKWHRKPNGRMGPCSAEKQGCPYGANNFHCEAETEQEAEELFAQYIKSLGQVGGVSTVSKREAVERAQRTEIERLAEHQRTGEPFSPEEIEERSRNLEIVYNDLKKRGKLSHDEHSVVYEGLRVWTPERLKAQEKVLNVFRERFAHVPAEGKVLVSGGLGGAGKSTTLRVHGVDLSHYAIINPDDIKEEMARQGMIPEVEGFAPMEVSTLVHEEASDMAKTLTGELALERRNIILDTTMSSAGSTGSKLEALKASGYTTVEAMFVDIPLEVSEERASARFRRGMADYITGKDPIGGRWLPSAVNSSQVPSNPEHFQSKNMEALLTLAEDEGIFTSEPVVYDNSGAGPVKMDYADLKHRWNILIPMEKAVLKNTP